MKKIYILIALLVLAMPAYAQTIPNSPQNVKIVRSTSVEGVRLNMSAEQAQAALFSGGYDGSLENGIHKTGYSHVTFTKDKNAMGQPLHTLSIYFRSNADKTPVAGEDILAINYSFNDFMNQNKMSGSQYNWSGTPSERHFNETAARFSINATNSSSKVRALKGSNITDDSGSYDFAASLMPQGRYVVVIRDNKAK